MFKTTLGDACFFDIKHVRLNPLHLSGEIISRPPNPFRLPWLFGFFVDATADCKTGRIFLTEQDVKLLKLFIANRGKPPSRKHLLKIGWGCAGIMNTRTVVNFVMRLRKYFEGNPRQPLYFRSLRSVGYIFDHEDPAPS